MEDILSRSRALRALAELRKIDPQPMTARMFMEATGYYSEPAQLLRQDLVSWGLITIKEKLRGKVPVQEIRLTDAGREVADLALRLEEAALRGRKGKKRPTHEGSS